MSTWVVFVTDSWPQIKVLHRKLFSHYPCPGNSLFRVTLCPLWKQCLLKDVLWVLLHIYIYYQFTIIVAHILLVTARKWSCGMVMFLHLSVILSGGGLSLSSGSLSRGISVQGGSLSGGVSVTEIPQYGGRAGGTHPTGMYSCFTFYSKLEMIHLAHPVLWGYTTRPIWQ